MQFHFMFEMELQKAKSDQKYIKHKREIKRTLHFSQLWPYVQEKWFKSDAILKCSAYCNTRFIVEDEKQKQWSFNDNYSETCVAIRFVPFDKLCENSFLWRHQVLQLSHLNTPLSHCISPNHLHIALQCISNLPKFAYAFCQFHTKFIL